VERFAVGRRQVHRGEEAPGIAIKRLQPQLFGTVVLAVVIDAVALEAFGQAAGNPVGDLVAGAFVLFDVGEGLGQQRLIAVGLLPVFGQGLRAKASDLEARLGMRVWPKTRKRRLSTTRLIAGLFVGGSSRSIPPGRPASKRPAPIEQSHPLALVLDHLK